MTEPTEISCTYHNCIRPPQIGELVELTLRGRRALLEVKSRAMDGGRVLCRLEFRSWVKRAAREHLRPLRGSAPPGLGRLPELRHQARRHGARPAAGALVMPGRPRLLDLYCCAGGAARGYHDAGFEVVGVDLKPQPHYPYEFHQADALEYLADHADEFDAFHGSPPCQRFSKSVKKKHRGSHADLVAATREAFIATGKPYVIENVPGAPLLNPVQLCGTAVGLRGIQRHRLFETNVPMLVPPCNHTINPPQYPPAWNRKNPLRVLSISGGYQKRQLSEDFMAMHKEAMGIDWEISYDELSQAIPPAYTRFIGEHIMASLRAGQACCEW